MRTIFIYILVSGLLCACGAKGPLYLPEKQYPQSHQESK